MNANSTQSGDVDGIEAGNVYVMSTSQDELNWSNSTFYNTDVTSFAVYSDLRLLNPVTVNVSVVPFNGTFPLNLSVTLSVPSTSPSIAFFNRVRLVGVDGHDITPSTFSDNFITLRQGESASIFVYANTTYSANGLKEPAYKIVVETFNNLAGASSL
jgi:exo-1,4-beta-D-glucosaminidase